MNKESLKEFLKFFFEVAVIALPIIFLTRYFLIQPFFVRGASMEPNFDNGQYLVIDELSYRFEKPERGQVIVFKYPNDPSQYYIKRIIGLPGETIELKDNQIIIYNQENQASFILNESAYLPYEPYLGNLKISLTQDEYFVLGDNRQASSDSRGWGPLPAKYIVGRVWLRAWPFNEARVFRY